MRPAAVQGKRMFNKRLMGEWRSRADSGAGAQNGQKKSRKSGSQELTGRRQTKWLQPLGKNPDHWMNTVNARKA